MGGVNTPHPSDSRDQVLAEIPILRALAQSLGVALEREVTLELGGEKIKPDGVNADRSVFAEVFSHIGKLKGGQRHKVSTDALKLLAIREIYPDARLILAFADEAAAKSVSGWKAQTLRANGIEVRVVDLGRAAREKIEAAQQRQRMINP